MYADRSEAEIMLYGEISHDMPEAWKWNKQDKSAADFDKAIKDVINNGARKLLLRVKCPGGYYNEAVAMRGILIGAEFDEINIRIEGLCASAATLIATIPGAHVSIMPGSEYMIHNPRAWGSGEARDFERAAKKMRSEEATSREFYAKKTGQTDEQLKEWMDTEKWFTADEAVQYGFCDELISEDEGSGIGEAVACATPRIMGVMKSMYNNVPENLAVRDETPDEATMNEGGEPKPSAEPTTTDVSNAKPTVAAGVAPEIQNKEEMSTMSEINEITREQLEAGNPAVCSALMQAGAEAERARMTEIDDLTPVGYEAMAEEAKKNGTSAMDFHKAIVKAQREKSTQFLADRKAETAQAAEIPGGASEDSTKKPDDEIAQNAKEVAEYAKAERKSLDGGMY
ncbi:MAG: Clp protease ClpP [Eubacteriales bacterium]|nr:Clp protease ClpP [Eubacteriales bacterium]